MVEYKRTPMTPALSTTWLNTEAARHNRSKDPAADSRPYDFGGSATTALGHSLGVLQLHAEFAKIEHRVAVEGDEGVACMAGDDRPQSGPMPRAGDTRCCRGYGTTGPL